MKLSPYEKENLIFIDTEFSDLDPYRGELLSIGIIKLDGMSLYLELDHVGEVHEWVKKHILPTLKQPKISREQAIVAIQTFLEQKNPFAVAFVDNYDLMYLTKLFGAGNLPFRWMTVDFASILFSQGINPVKFLADQDGAKKFYKELGIDVHKYQQHHALDDARLLRDVWLKVAS